MAQTQKKKINLFLLLGLAWFCPGAGHYLLGKKFRAVLFFVTVGFFFWLAIYLKAYITFPGDSEEPFALFKFLGALGSGVHFLITLILGQGMGDQTVIQQLKAAFTNEFGNTFLYTAGIINILTVVDAFDIFRGRKH